MSRQSDIKWRSRDVAELKRQIKNYNARVRYRQKKDSSYKAPILRYSEIKEGITTRREFNATLRTISQASTTKFEQKEAKRKERAYKAQERERKRQDKERAKWLIEHLEYDEKRNDYKLRHDPIIMEPETNDVKENKNLTLATAEVEESETPSNTTTDDDDIIERARKTVESITDEDYDLANGETINIEDIEETIQDTIDYDDDEPVTPSQAAIDAYKEATLGVSPKEHNEIERDYAQLYKWQQQRNAKNDAYKSIIDTDFTDNNTEMPTLKDYPEIELDFDDYNDIERTNKALKKYYELPFEERKASTDTYTTKKDIEISADTYEAIIKNLAIINFRIEDERKRRKEFASTEKGTMGTLRDADLLPKPNRLEQLKSYEDIIAYKEKLEYWASTDYLKDQNFRYFVNYIKALQNNGYTKDEITTLVNIIRKIPISRFIEASYTDARLEINFHYGTELHDLVYSEHYKALSELS